MQLCVVRAVCQWRVVMLLLDAHSSGDGPCRSFVFVVSDSSNPVATTRQSSVEDAGLGTRILRLRSSRWRRRRITWAAVTARPEQQAQRTRPRRVEMTTGDNDGGTQVGGDTGLGPRRQRRWPTVARPGRSHRPPLTETEAAWIKGSD